MTNRAAAAMRETPAFIADFVNYRLHLHVHWHKRHDQTERLK
jgi:hypothetical protein